MQREQKKKLWIGILAGVFVSVTLLLATFVIGAFYFFFGGPADYLAEVERLENTKKVYGTTERTLAQGAEGQFQYPAYMAIDGCNYAFEYEKDSIVQK